MSRAPLKFLQTVLLVFLLCIAAGCSSSGEQDLAHQPAQHQFSDFYEEGEDYPVDVYDPLEGFNRGVYKFNAVFDKYVFLPVVGAYETVTPEFARQGVSNFFTNIGEITTFANACSM
jgi:phospholipid-binding lipoprotein MlaA